MWAGSIGTSSPQTSVCSGQNKVLCQTRSTTTVCWTCDCMTDKHIAHTHTLRPFFPNPLSVKLISSSHLLFTPYAVALSSPKKTAMMCFYCCPGVWRAIDFGLARKHMDDDGVPFPARPDAAFRGSRAYASVHAHQDTDLGRRDDLWSWFYMLVRWLAACTHGWLHARTVDTVDCIYALQAQCASNFNPCLGSDVHDECLCCSMWVLV